jgi:hypothetical protein
VHWWVVAGDGWVGTVGLPRAEVCPQAKGCPAAGRTSRCVGVAHQFTHSYLWALCPLRHSLTNRYGAILVAFLSRHLCTSGARAGRCDASR